MSEKEWPQEKGIFSGRNLPEDWTSQRLNPKPYLQALNDVYPDTMRLVSQIVRGSNNATFALQSSEGLRVCQFTPISKLDSGAISVVEITDHLRNNGIEVPEILANGIIYINNEPNRYIVMDFVKGVNADIFLGLHPNKSQEVYYKFGEILARLRKVPLKEKQSRANEHVLGKVRYAGNFLVQNQVFSLRHIRQLIGILEKRLSLLGNPQMSYVHLDPFPMNFQITGNFNNFHVTLMDIEAIKGGHPLVEGLGRALKWGIYDWDYISGKTLYDISSITDSFLRGYSEFSPDAIQYMQSSSDLELLIETTELVSLPESILKESEKEEPAEYYEWSKNRLLQLIEK